MAPNGSDAPILIVHFRTITAFALQWASRVTSKYHMLRESDILLEKTSNLFMQPLIAQHHHEHSESVQLGYAFAGYMAKGSPVPVSN